MNQPGPISTLSTMVLLGALAATEAMALAPTRCADPTVMRTTLSQFAPPILQVYLRKQNPPPGGSAPTPDPLVNHIQDFFTLAYQAQPFAVDPRLAPAIAGAESTMGTRSTQCVMNDNPWNLYPDQCKCVWHKDDGTCECGDYIYSGGTKDQVLLLPRSPRLRVRAYGPIRVHWSRG